MLLDLNVLIVGLHRRRLHLAVYRVQALNGVHHAVKLFDLVDVGVATADHLSDEGQVSQISAREVDWFVLGAHLGHLVNQDDHCSWELCSAAVFVSREHRDCHYGICCILILGVAWVVELLNEFEVRSALQVRLAGYSYHS